MSTHSLIRSRDPSSCQSLRWASGLQRRWIICFALEELPATHSPSQPLRGAPAGCLESCTAPGWVRGSGKAPQRTVPLGISGLTSHPYPTRPQKRRNSDSFLYDDICHVLPWMVWVAKSLCGLPSTWEQLVCNCLAHRTDQCVSRMWHLSACIGHLNLQGCT